MSRVAATPRAAGVCWAHEQVAAKHVGLDFFFLFCFHCFQVEDLIGSPKLQTSTPKYVRAVSSATHVPRSSNNQLPKPSADSKLTVSSYRSKQRDLLFASQLWDAFDAMELTSISNLPPTQVLARDPAQPSPRMKCPPALWKVIQDHGGYIEVGACGVSRHRIKVQFDLWKKSRFGATSDLVPATNVDNMIRILGGLVPTAARLVA